jgi:RNA polymerase primary sigma factor
VGKYKQLTQKEEVALAKKARKGDENALNKLINSNLKFVVSIAKQYIGQGLDLEDLIAEGNIGVIKAARNFDPELGFKFITYAVWWIRQAILAAISENSNLIRLPNNRIHDMKQMRKKEEKLVQELERELTSEEREQLSRYKKLGYMYINNTISLNDLDDNDNERLETFIYFQDSPDDKLEQESVREYISQLLAVCTFREKDIITLYLGLGGIKPLTLEQIGKLYNLSRERVRQIKESAIKKLKKKRIEYEHDVRNKR